MSATKSHVARRAGFTMVEILVVMGIIGILAAVMLPLLSGSRSSALTAQCKNNMKSLALGAIAYAQNDLEHHYFPQAGFYVSRGSFGFEDPTRRKKAKADHGYIARKAWLKNYGSYVNNDRDKPTFSVGTLPHFTDGVTLGDKQLRAAVEGGAIWETSGKSYDAYRCPVHAQRFKKKNNCLPGWSYMMNQAFGYEHTGKGVHGYSGQSYGGRILSTSPDKVLMFAEVQGEDVNDTKNGITLKALVSGSDFKTDGILEYAQEAMGFNHPLGKGRYGGNVAFADGHVDTVVMPTKVDRKKFTEHLCKGYDVPHDGSKYNEADYK